MSNRMMKTQIVTGNASYVDKKPSSKPPPKKVNWIKIVIIIGSVIGSIIGLVGILIFIGWFMNRRTTNSNSK